MAPKEYDQRHLDSLIQTLRLYFERLDDPSIVTAGRLTFALKSGAMTMPTQADVATLRVGEVYRDTTADNVLKVKA